MTTTVAVLTDYAPPYYKERAWNLDQYHDWEKGLLAAVKVGGVTAIEDMIDGECARAFDEFGNSWGRPYGKTRVFALDYNPDIIQAGCEYINEDTDRMHPIPHATKLRGWRQLRAVTFTPFDPTLTDNMINDLAIVEEGVLEELRRNDLQARDQMGLL